MSRALLLSNPLYSRALLLLKCSNIAYIQLFFVVLTLHLNISFLCNATTRRGNCSYLRKIKCLQNFATGETLLFLGYKLTEKQKKHLKEKRDDGFSSWVVLELFLVVSVLSLCPYDHLVSSCQGEQTHRQATGHDRE